MEQDPNQPARGSEDWLRAEAHGDEVLYNLLTEKERIGNQIASGEIDRIVAKPLFATLNEAIMKRHRQLGSEGPEADSDG